MKVPPVLEYATPANRQILPIPWYWLIAGMWQPNWPLYCPRAGTEEVVVEDMMKPPVGDWAVVLRRRRAHGVADLREERRDGEPGHLIPAH